MSHLLESLMYQASQVFLFPTLVVIAVLFVYAFFLLGMFAMQWWQRRQGQGGQPTRGHHLLAWAQAQPGASADELDVKAHQLLELEYFHPGKTRRQIEQLLAQHHCPVHLHHTRQHRCFGEMAAEERQVRRDRQFQRPLTGVFALAQHFRQLGPGCE